MTINELYKVWLHNGNPKAEILVWDRNIGDYIFSSKNPIKNQDFINKLENMQVECFYCTYDNKQDQEILVINVGNY